MSETARELSELKREIVEARNQAIKTDNQVKNLSLDVKGFEKRFDILERRTRLSSLGVNLIIALTIGLSAYAVISLRTRGYENVINQLRREGDSERLTGGYKQEELQSKLVASEKSKKDLAAAEELTLQILGHLDAKRDREAVEALANLHIEHLTPLTRKLVEKRLLEVRAKSSEVAYKTARSLVLANRLENAVSEFQKVLRLDEHGRNAASSRYLLSLSLYMLKRFKEVESVLHTAIAQETDKDLNQDLQYLLAGTLLQLGKPGEAQAEFTKLAAGGRYEKLAKAYKAALEAGGEVPEVPEVRIAMRNNNIRLALVEGANPSPLKNVHGLKKSRGSEAGANSTPQTQVPNQAATSENTP